MDIKGRKGLPYSRKRFVEWIERFLRRHGNYHFNDFKKPWIVYPRTLIADDISVLRTALTARCPKDCYDFSTVIARSRLQTE